MNVHTLKNPRGKKVGTRGEKCEEVSRLSCVKGGNVLRAPNIEHKEKNNESKSLKSR